MTEEPMDEGVDELVDPVEGPAEEPGPDGGAGDLQGDVVSDLEGTVGDTERVRTGVSSVDSVVDDVARLAGQPVEEHAAVYESAHERLRRTLDDPEADLQQEP
jgi:hypothetical protein